MVECRTFFCTANLLQRCVPPGGAVEILRGANGAPLRMTARTAVLFTPKVDLVRLRLAQSIVNDLLCFADDGFQMRLVLKTLGIDFVDIFRAGRPRSEPSAGCDHL